MRPIGLPAVDMLETGRPREAVGPVFRGFLDGKPLIGFPKHWDKMFAKTRSRTSPPMSCATASPASRTSASPSRPSQHCWDMRRDR